MWHDGTGGGKQLGQKAKEALDRSKVHNSTLSARVRVGTLLHVAIDETFLNSWIRKQAEMIRINAMDPHDARDVHTVATGVHGSRPVLKRALSLVRPKRSAALPIVNRLLLCGLRHTFVQIAASGCCYNIGRRRLLPSL